MFPVPVRVDGWWHHVMVNSYHSPWHSVSLHYLMLAPVLGTALYSTVLYYVQYCTLRRAMCPRCRPALEVWQSGLMMSSKIWAILTFWVMECEWSVAAKTNDLIVCKSHGWSSYIITSRGSTQNCSFFQSVPNFRFKTPDNVDWLHWWTRGSQLYRLLCWSGKLATVLLLLSAKQTCNP